MADDKRLAGRKNPAFGRKTDLDDLLFYEGRLAFATDEREFYIATADGRGADVLDKIVLSSSAVDVAKRATVIVPDAARVDFLDAGVEQDANKAKVRTFTHFKLQDGLTTGGLDDVVDLTVDEGTDSKATLDVFGFIESHGADPITVREHVKNKVGTQGTRDTLLKTGDSLLLDASERIFALPPFVQYKLQVTGPGGQNAVGYRVHLAHRGQP